MVLLNLVMNGEGIIAHIPKDKLIVSDSVVTLAALGTSKGKPSLAIIFMLPDGTTVLAQDNNGSLSISSQGVRC